MAALPSLGLSPRKWSFLQRPLAYVKASEELSARGELHLVPESTRRQFKTARDILRRLNGRKPIKGVLLADDVGLGKTKVAALVAWVVASAKREQGQKQCKVLVLAPNDVVKRQWKDELEKQVKLLAVCADHLKAAKTRLKDRGNLTPGSIRVVNHSYVTSKKTKKKPLDCDLLIVDEAHRAKGDSSKFSKALKDKVKHASRVLILTATPFSIEVEDLKRMLKLIGAIEACKPVTDFKKSRDCLYSTGSGDSTEFAKNLRTNVKNAITAFSEPVIRHGVDDLGSERKSFGELESNGWTIDVEQASGEDLKLMLRIDRALRLEKGIDSERTSKITNDPRFHVGWRHFDAETERLSSAHSHGTSEKAKVITRHVKQIQDARDTSRPHPKMKAIEDPVWQTVKNGEKVVLFCYHHATAQELTLHLADEIPEAVAPESPNCEVWKRAWNAVLETIRTESLTDSQIEKRHTEPLLVTFIDWLCSDLIRSQVASWLDAVATTDTELARQLENKIARPHPKNKVTIANAARQLYQAILKNDSSYWLLRRASRPPRSQLLQGVNEASRVLGVSNIKSDVKKKKWERSLTETERRLFMHSHQPDLVLEIFNSPFGPDVLVATDQFSEGINLHRYCRHLIHYELGPSPIRTVQRNGRIRRVNSWAAVTRQKIQYAFPFFGRTRDQSLVRIMRKRIKNFSLLLGGVPDINLDDKDTGADELWRQEVIESALAGLERFRKKMLNAKDKRSRTSD